MIAPCSGLTKENREILKKFLREESLADFARFQDSDEKYLAAPDEIRWSAFKQALKAKADLLWCVRGGYGLVRLLTKLQNLKRPAKVPTLLGISDVTILHVLWNHLWKKPSLHGPLVDRVMLKKLPLDVEEEFWRIYRGEQKEVVHRLSPLNQKAQKLKISKGQLVGGNLSTLCSILGSDLKFSWKGKWVFLEDIGERGYRVDRLLSQLENAGKFVDVQGVLFGHLTQSQESDGEDLAPVALEHFASRASFPVFAGVESGHGERLRMVPFLTPAVIDQGVLRVQNPLAWGKK